MRFGHDLNGKQWSQQECSLALHVYGLYEAWEGIYADKTS